MRATLASLGVWLVWALVGCASSAPSSSTAPRTSPSPTPVAGVLAPPPQACGAKVTSLTCTSSKFCPVVVFKGPGEKWNVFPYNLKVANPNATIIWILLDGSSFDSNPSKMHGIRLKLNGGGQFSDGSATDELNNAPAPRPRGPHYRVKFANTGASSKDIEYLLAFEDSSGNQVVCDPLINNSGLD